MDTKQLKVDPETHERLIYLSQTTKISMKDIVGTIARMAQEYDLLNPYWKDELVAKTLDQYKAKLQEQTAQAIEKRKMEWKLRFKHDLLMQYVKALDPVEKRTFIENLLGNLEDPNFIDQLGEMEIVLVDGKRKLVRMEKGKPMIGVDPDQIIACDVGYHIRGNFCTCKRWRDCELRVGEYVDYKVRHREY